MDKEKPEKKKQPLTNPETKQHFGAGYGKYSAMVFQMAAIIGFGIWSGIKLDQYFGFKKFPAFTVSLSLLSIFASMYFVIRGITKK